MAGLFALGALLPLGVLILLVVLGAWGLAAAVRWRTGTGGLLALLGLGNGLVGLALAFRSFPPPKGRTLGPEEAPLLEAYLQEQSQSWAGPKAGGVILDPDAWGVDLVGVPTLGLLGWTRFRWFLGIYPLLALSARELDTLVSWEVVWWSDQQGWLNLQVKRLVAYWQRLDGALGPGRQFKFLGQDLGALIFIRAYARWMARRTDTFLARECLWNDAVVAKQHGTATFGRALCRMAILKALVDRRVFPAWEDRLLAGEVLPEDLYAQMAQALGRWPESSAGLLELALDGLNAQAPPLLRLRLEQLEAHPVPPMPPGEPALNRLLGGTDLLHRLEAGFLARLHGHVLAGLQTKALKELRYAELALTVAGAFPEHPRAGEYLDLAVDRAPVATLAPLLEAFARLQPGAAQALLLPLRWHLRRGQYVEAEAQARRTMADNPFLAPLCHTLLGDHLKAQGDQTGAERQWNLARRAEAQVERARHERHSASLGDPLEPHGCAAGQLEPMVNYLRSLPGVGEAYLVGKRVALHPDHPVLLLVVRQRGAWWDVLGRRRVAFQDRIARECPFPLRATGFVLVAQPVLLWRHKGLLRRMAALIHST